MVALKTLRWVDCTREDMRQFPGQARRNIAYALQFAQAGTKHPSAKSLHGVGSGVLEVVQDYAGDSYHAVYAVRFAQAIYVLHAFKNKSKSAIKTPSKDIDLIRTRIRLAHQERRQFESVDTGA